MSYTETVRSLQQAYPALKIPSDPSQALTYLARELSLSKSRAEGFKSQLDAALTHQHKLSHQPTAQIPPQTHRETGIVLLPKARRKG